MKDKEVKFSVLMSVYKNETVNNLVEALNSVINQTLQADEIVIVRDGPVSTEMQKCLEKYTKENSNIVLVPLEENVGLGKALNKGLEVVSNSIVARMDTDDIAVPDRFEKQIEFLVKNPNVDVLGGQIREFIGDIDNLSGIRKTPVVHSEIIEYMKKRNPFNHMTVMFRKDKVIEAGNYMDFHYMEDYYLWCRMYMNGCEFANLPEILVYARIGEDMFKRRGGYKYFKSWKRLEKYKLENNITNKLENCETLITRFAVQVLMPNWCRGLLLKKLSREKA